MVRKRALRWVSPALRDLVAAHAYLQERSPEAARRFARQVREITEHLKTHPLLGAALRGVPLAGEVRSVVIGSHRLIYRVLDKELLVLRLWDCRQDPDRLWED